MKANQTFENTPLLTLIWQITNPFSSTTSTPPLPLQHMLVVKSLQNTSGLTEVELHLDRSAELWMQRSLILAKFLSGIMTAPLATRLLLKILKLSWDLSPTSLIPSVVVTTSWWCAKHSSGRTHNARSSFLQTRISGISPRLYSTNQKQPVKNLGSE